MNPREYARRECTLCWGIGIRPCDKICTCVVLEIERERTKLEAEREALSDWERLWLDAQLQPYHFPLHPVPSSSLFSCLICSL